MANIDLIRSKLDGGKFIPLKEKRYFIRHCIHAGQSTDQIVEKFSKYNINESQFAFIINSMRDYTNRDFR